MPYDCTRRGVVHFSTLVGTPTDSYAECEVRCNGQPNCAKYYATRDEEDIRGSCFLFDNSVGKIAHELNQDPHANETWCVKRGVPPRRVAPPPGTAPTPVTPPNAIHDEKPVKRNRRVWIAAVAIGVLAILVLLFIVWIVSR